ncbi:MAG TPA: hypothetical protein PK963_05080 [Arachnia sp.]|nr:hypothetical protein [Arachnia sp.]
MADVLAALLAALTLDQVGIAAADLWDAVGVAALASLSTMLGHSAVLALNRIRGLRLLSTLVLNAVVLSSLRILQAAITWTVAGIVLGHPVPLLDLVIVALLSLAPQVFGVVTAMPHAGLFIGRVLEAWQYLVLVVGVSATFGVTLATALGITLVGWVVMQMVSRLLRVPATWLGSRLWTLATGRPTMVTARDILAGTPLMPVEVEGVRP